VRQVPDAECTPVQTAAVDTGRDASSMQDLLEKVKNQLVENSVPASLREKLTQVPAVDMRQLEYHLSPPGYHASVHSKR
jgi:hypothetical protein